MIVNSGTVGSATDITVTYSQVTTAGTTTVTSPTTLPSTLPTGVFELSGTNLVFDVTTTAVYTTPIIIAYQLPSSIDQATFSALTVLHWNTVTSHWDDATIYSGPFAPNFTTKTIYASVSSLSPFVIAKETLKAQIQPPISSNGSSVFNVKRGYLPVNFTLTSNGVPTCQLPSATISLIRNGSTVVKLSSSNFKISTVNCQYVYTLNTGSLGVGKYKANILIGGVVVGSGTFALK